MSRATGRPVAADVDSHAGGASTDVPAVQSTQSSADSFAEARLVFLVGCARSGTTWLQLLLSQHPSIATSQETHLFSRYLSRLERGWRFEHDPDIDRRRNTGLAAVVDDSGFYQLCHTFASDVLRRVLASRPGASIVLEKTPSHVHHAELIRRLYPGAYFLHLIRDPRSVVASLLGAGRSWGKHWAPTNAAAAARTWLRDVTAGREIRSSTDRYFELRYEDLADDGVHALQNVLHWLDLPVDADFAQRAIDACDIDRLRSATESVDSPWSLQREPQGFYRRGSVSGWRDELSSSDVATIEYVAGPLMNELGYAPVTRAINRRPVRLMLRDALRPRLEMAHRRLEQWAQKL